MNYYFCKDGTTVEGPLPLAEISRRVAARMLPGETQVCLEGQTTWHPIASLTRKTTLLQPAPPRPPGPGAGGQNT